MSGWEAMEQGAPDPFFAEGRAAILIALDSEMPRGVAELRNPDGTVAATITGVADSDDERDT